MKDAEKTYAICATGPTVSNPISASPNSATSQRVYTPLTIQVEAGKQSFFDVLLNNFTVSFAAI